MKNIKNILLSISSMIVIIFSSQSATAAPNFEVFNKANEPIGIRIFADQDVYTDIVKPGTGNQYQKSIDTSGSVEVEIYPDTATTLSLNSQLKFDLGRNKFVIKANGKTVFLTWNPKESPSLYPQTGKGLLRSFGGAKTSESGHPLANNITQGQIVKR